MKKIIEVLRLKHDARLSHEEIARVCSLFQGVGWLTVEEGPTAGRAGLCVSRIFSLGAGRAGAAFRRQVPAPVRRDYALLSHQKGGWYLLYALRDEISGLAYLL